MLDTPLGMTSVLVLDCQATGASPRHGNLLELAWCTVRGTAPVGSPMESHLVAQPAGSGVPPRVARLTGIGDSDLRHAVDTDEVWRRFWADVRRMEAEQGGPVPTVVHYARYERSFLDDMARAHGLSSLPLDYICTHEVARRLLPGVPRLGLRPLAGYFGHVLGEHKRAAPHVGATLAVWRELVPRLRAVGVHTLGQLRSWLSQSRPMRSTGPWQFRVQREVRLSLPDQPGIYRMLGRGGEVLYVGKAASLRKRVNSYFQKRKHETRQTLEMLTQTWRVETSLTGSALEAALLEADEIKRTAPPYNTALKPRHEASAGLWFSSDAFWTPVPQPERESAVGPFPAPEPLCALAFLDHVLRQGVPWLFVSPDQRRSLGLPTDEEVLGERTLRRALWRFVQTHGPSCRAFCCRPGAAVLRVGASLWRRRRREEEGAAAADGQDDSAAVDEGRLWDTDRVLAALERAARHGARLVRRAHWLVQLSESTVAWSAVTDDVGDTWHVLGVEAGHAPSSQTLGSHQELPRPTGAERPTLGRLRLFDPATHDRLRVLTTELRRLLAEGRRVAVVLENGKTLDNNALSRRLSWF